MAPMKRPAQGGSGRSSLSLTTLARRWHVRRREVRRLLEQGRLPFEQVRGQLRVPRDSIQRYEQSGMPGLATPK